MYPAREAQLFQRGCLTVAVAVTGLCSLAYFAGRSFLWAAGGIVVTWGIICLLKNWRDKRRLNDALVDAFRGFDGSVPKLKVSNSYGHPFFSVCFSSKEDRKRAFERGHLKTFRTAVQALYEFGGFDIEKGFDETYLGWEADFLGSWDAESENSLFKDPMNNSSIVEKMRLRELYYAPSKNR
jgi:hypothetical protein